MEEINVEKIGKLTLTQETLIKAIEYYLNDNVFKNEIKVNYIVPNCGYITNYGGVCYEIVITETGMPNRKENGGRKLIT
jgi:hypothetical protein